MAATPKNPLQEFFSELDPKDRELVIGTLDLQLTTRKPLSEDEKQGQLEAKILKQAD